MLRSNPNLFEEEKELPAPQTPPAPVQILDAIAFEELYEAGRIPLLDTPPETPKTTAAATGEPATTATIVKPVKKAISLKEKIYILTSSFIPAIGFGLGNTLAVLVKFVAPVAGVGGAGLSISTGLMIGLTGGFGLVAVGLMGMMYYSSYKDATKKIETFNHQLERFQKEINQKAARILEDFNNAFAMLLKMKLAVEQLKRAREASDPDSFPSQTEKTIQKRINSYINFLAQHQDHPNFQKIQDKTFRDEEIAGARQRQINLRNKLYEASEKILNDTTISVKDYAKRAEEYVDELKNKKIFEEGKELTEEKVLRDSCFPNLHFVAPKAKRPPFININLREFFTSFGSAFGPIFGLPFLTIAIIGVFTTIPMAFPPLWPILALGVVYGMYNVYRVNDIKKLDAERNVEKQNKQKHLAYFHYSHNTLLKDRFTAELDQYSKYQYDVMTTQSSSLKPKLSPEFKKQPPTGPALFQNKAVDYIPSSDKDLKRSTEGEDIHFYTENQFTSRVNNNPTLAQSQNLASSEEEIKKTLPSITTPGFSVFNSSSSKSSEFSSSSQNLLGLEKLQDEDLSFRTESQLLELRKSSS